MTRPLPWRLADVRAALLLIGVGGLVAAAGWWGASQSVTVPKQVPWTGVAVAGLLAAHHGAAWIVLAGRIALRRRHGVLAVQLSLVADGRAAVPAIDGVLVAGERMTRFHRPTCLAVAGKSVGAAPLGAHRDAGRRPCDLCRP